MKQALAHAESTAAIGPARHVRPARRVRVGLWKGTGLLAAFFLTAFALNFFLPADKAVTRQMLGQDFLAFYSAGRLARTGHVELLYDLPSIVTLENTTARGVGIDRTVAGPWWNPPFAVWIFEPLAALPYNRALAVWWFVSALAATGSVAMLWEMLPASAGLSAKLLIPALMLFAIPAIQAASHGQNTFLSLLILCGAVRLSRQGHGFAAGMVCGLLAYKPQLGLVAAVMLVALDGMPALGGMAATGLGLLLVTVFTMPDALGEWIVQLPRVLRHVQVDNAYMWDRHVTLKAFWRLLLQGKAAGEMTVAAQVAWMASEAMAIGALAWCAVHLRRLRVARGVRGIIDPADGASNAIGADCFMAACIVAMPLLMPFYFDYDLTLLAVAATLTASLAWRMRLHRATGWAWMALYLTAEVSTPIAGATRCIPTTIALSVLLGFLTRECLALRRPIALPAAQPGQGTVDAGIAIAA